MYGNVYIDSLRLGGRKLPTYELMLRLLGVATMYGWIFGLFIMYILRSKRQKTEAEYKFREFSEIYFRF